MVAFKITCPQCQAGFRPSGEPRVGNDVICPRCQHSFAVQADMIVPTSGSMSRPPVLEADLERTKEPSPPDRPPAMGILEKPKKPTRLEPKPPPVPETPAAPPPAAPPARIVAPVHVGLPSRGVLVGVAVLLLVGITSAAVYFISRPDEEKPALPKGVETELVLAETLPTSPRRETPLEPRPEPAPPPPVIEPSHEEESEPAKKATPEAANPEPEKKPTAPKRVLPKKAEAPAVKVPALPAAAGVTKESLRNATLRGIAYLKSRQNGAGTWSPGDPIIAWAAGNHSVGYASLASLALLESGVLPTDPYIQ